MMTGDSERTARAVAAQIGVDEYYSEVLPEDKAGVVEREKAAGRKEPSGITAAIKGKADRHERGQRNKIVCQYRRS